MVSAIEITPKSWAGTATIGAGVRIDDEGGGPGYRMSYELSVTGVHPRWRFVRFLADGKESTSRIPEYEFTDREISEIDGKYHAVEYFGSGRYVMNVTFTAIRAVFEHGDTMHILRAPGGNILRAPGGDILRDE